MVFPSLGWWLEGKDRWRVSGDNGRECLGSMGGGKKNEKREEGKGRGR